MFNRKSSGFLTKIYYNMSFRAKRSEVEKSISSASINSVMLDPSTSPSQTWFRSGWHFVKTCEILRLIKNALDRAPVIVYNIYYMNKLFLISLLSFMFLTVAAGVVSAYPISSRSGKSPSHPPFYYSRKSPSRPPIYSNPPVTRNRICAQSYPVRCFPPFPGHPYPRPL